MDRLRPGDPDRSPASAHGQTRDPPPICAQALPLTGRCDRDRGAIRARSLRSLLPADEQLSFSPRLVFCRWDNRSEALRDGRRSRDLLDGEDRPAQSAGVAAGGVRPGSSDFGISSRTGDWKRNGSRQMQRLQDVMVECEQRRDRKALMIAANILNRSDHAREVQIEAWRSPTMSRAAAAPAPRMRRETRAGENP